MADPSTLQDLYTRLLMVNADAHAAGLYNASYHALAAAMHCARALPDDEPLEHVGAIAREQLAAIDSLAPDYEHSTRSSASRGHDNIFALLARQTHAVLEMRKADRQREAWDLTRRPAD
jgi:hypothetical protein